MLTSSCTVMRVIVFNNWLLDIRSSELTASINSILWVMQHSLTVKLFLDVKKSVKYQNESQPNKSLTTKSSTTDLWQWSPWAWALCGHCQDSSDAKRHSGRGRIHVNPKGDPGQNNNQQRWDVHLDQVVAHLPLQVEPHFNTSKFTCNITNRQQTFFCLYNTTKLYWFIFFNQLHLELSASGNLLLLVSTLGLSWNKVLRYYIFLRQFFLRS